MKRILPILLLSGFVFISHHSHAQTRERLIAVCQYNGDTGVYTIYDSITYNYTGTRSIDSSWGVLQAFDTSYSWLYNKDTGYIYYQKQIQTWGTALHPQTDTAWQWNRATNQFVYYYYNVFSYNAQNLPDTAFGQDWSAVDSAWGNPGEGIKYYNSNNAQVYEVGLGWDTSSSSWDTSTTSTITYDSLGRADTAIYIDIFNNHHYEDQVIFTYDSLGRITSQTDLLRSSDTGVWQNSEQWIFTYDSLNNISVMMEMEWDTTHWATGDSTSYTYDANHNQIGHIEYLTNYNGGWVNYILYIATFDTFNMITTSTQLTWHTASSTWLPEGPNIMYHYYYETYTIPVDTTIDTTSIATITESGDARIYPVPAADMLSVDIHWTEAQQATISIYDINGRKCGDWPTTCTASWHGYIPLAALPAGAYTMLIRGISGSIRKEFNVVR